LKITDILAKDKPSFSFEFFPPKSDEGVAALMQTASSLRPLEPAFVSVTYGAGGGTRARTIDVVKAMKNLYSMLRQMEQALRDTPLHGRVRHAREAMERDLIRRV